MTDNGNGFVTSCDLVVGPPISVGLKDARTVLFNILKIWLVNLILMAMRDIPSIRGAKGSLTSIARTFQSVSPPLSISH